MDLRRMAISAGLLAGHSIALAQTTFIETFETGTNVGGWSWGTGNHAIVQTNGNPGAYLQDLTLASCCPTISTRLGLPSTYTGNYRDRGVSAVGIDLVTIDTGFGIGDRPLTVMLLDDNDTPFVFEDDSVVYFIGDVLVPAPGVDRGDAPRGWTSYHFGIPADHVGLPEGWLAYSPVVEPDDAIWERVIVDVDALQFFYGDPRDIFLFNSWDVGLDNPWITEGAVGGCNAADVAEPFDVLDLGDVQAFIGAFVNGDGLADVAPPAGVLDLADVQAFIAAFVAGCP